MSQPSQPACNHYGCTSLVCRYKLTPEQERMAAEQLTPYYTGSVAADEETQERWKEAGLFTTKDSGKREEYASGMVRDTEEGKARFDLLLPKGVPYANQMLTRFAELMARGAGKYGDRNWEKARGQEELDRYRSSALRHLQQWVAGEDDEDHAAAVMFNLMAGETVKFKMEDAAPTKVAISDAVEHFVDPEAGAYGHEDRDGCLAVLAQVAGWPEKPSQDPC